MKKFNWAMFFVLMGCKAESAKGISSSCESISVQEGNDAFLRFNFGADIETLKLGIDIVIHRNGRREKEYIHVGYFKDVLNIQPQNTTFGVIESYGYSLTLKIIKVNKEYSGTYSALVQDSRMEEVTSCTVIVRDSHGKSGVGSYTSAVVTWCAISTLISILCFKT